MNRLTAAFAKPHPALVCFITAGAWMDRFPVCDKKRDNERL